MTSPTVVIALLLLLVVQLTVGGPEFVQLDLFDSLHLHNSTYQGVTLGMGVHTLSPGVIFTGDIRETMVSGDWVDRVRGKLSEIGANEFTISAIIKQNPNNVGTLLAFSRGLFSALEIQSSGRKNELRVISGSAVETFPFRLADGSWHRLAISFSASQVDILVDCTPVYRRVLKFDPASAIFDARNISLWIGQRTSQHFLYQGVMQDLRLTFGPYGYLSQCPQMDSQCPTCSDYTALKLSFASLQSQLQLITDRLNRAEARLSSVEQCECQKSCRVNDTSVFSDGSTWNSNCDVCTCLKGEIECHRKECPRVTCKNPIQRHGECCPTCLKKCYFKERIYDHGEVESLRQCVKCQCMDGSMQCKPMDPLKICPPLSCPLADQMSVPGECCKICPGTDHCASQGHQCHSNATCMNLQTTFTCQCKDGFSGDGLKACEDLDECLLERNHCARNSECVNTLGSYFCQCLEGFKKLNQFQCEDEDECSNGSHQCHTHATCENIKGSYTCTCEEGYSGNGFQCAPICNRTCENGGVCIAPGVCSCRSGWTGPQCETDIDECLEKSTNSSTGYDCPANAKCVNKPGWYLCQCDEGFQANLAQGGEARCQDLDECLSDPCSEGLQCFNTIGSYECHCLDSDQKCGSAGCFEGGKMYLPGSKWFSQDCSICTCTSPGATSCQPCTEDEGCSQLCSVENSNTITSPHECCDKYANVTAKALTAQKTCRHQLYPETYYESGQLWHFQCQTCECLNGEVDCWKIDCPPVNCPNPVLPAGDCCYRCPEDKCTHWHRNSTFTECNLLENTIESGTQVTLPHNHCISCKCQVPLCAKSVSYNDGFCVLRTESSVVLMTTIVWLITHLMTLS